MNHRNQNQKENLRAMPGFLFFLVLECWHRNTGLVLQLPGSELPCMLGRERESEIKGGIFQDRDRV
jgi:hypothetical protein